MTVTELAREIGVTAQAIYKRAKARDIRLSELKEADGKNLTPEGLSILSDMMEFKRVETSLETEFKRVDKHEAESLNELKTKVDELKEEKAELMVKVAELTKEVEAKGEVIAVLREQLTYTQRLQAVTLQKIPTEKPSIWQRITGKVKKIGRPMDVE